MSTVVDGTTRSYGWLKVMFALIGGLLIGGTGQKLAVPGALPQLFGNEQESRNTQVVNAVTLEDQVVLLSLGIQGIAERSSDSTFLGVRVPGSGRASFIQYNHRQAFDRGGDVRIRQSGDAQYTADPRLPVHRARRRVLPSRSRGQRADQLHHPLRPTRLT